jgi:hypothetical protein
MSEIDQYDPYDKSSGGKPGKPVVSWKKADVGDEFEGIVVPADFKQPEKGYAVSQEWDNKARQPRVWAPKGYTTPKGPYRGPITEMEYIAAVGSAQGARPVTRPDIRFVTDYRKFEFVSGPAKVRAQEEGTDDDGIRRVIIDGQSIREAHTAALEAIGADRPQPGQRWKIRLATQEPTPEGGHKNTFQCTIWAPTPETMKVVEEQIAKDRATAEAETPDASDPYNAPAGVGAGSQSEEPPF